jgi:hypothetical protein
MRPFWDDRDRRTNSQHKAEVITALRQNGRYDLSCLVLPGLLLWPVPRRVAAGTRTPAVTAATTRASRLPQPSFPGFSESAGALTGDCARLGRYRAGRPTQRSRRGQGQAHSPPRARRPNRGCVFPELRRVDRWTRRPGSVSSLAPRLPGGFPPRQDRH